MDAERRIADLEATLAEREAAFAALLAERDARIAALEAQVKQFKELVESLQAQLSANSRNSGRPPSSDGPGARSGKGKGSKSGGSGKKRGGQPGHQGNRRELLPVEAVDHVVDVYPPTCENCETALPAVADWDPMRHQVTELPEPRPEVTEFRCHAVDCTCGHRTRASLGGLASSAFGPRLSAVIAMLTGVYHLSRRTAQRATKELLGVEISLGAISDIEHRVEQLLEPAVDEAWAKVETAKVKYTDGTTWLEAGVTMQLWTIAAACATVFKILTEATAPMLRPLFGKRIGTLVSDRATALYFWAMDARQICWAHLVRRFVSFSERDGGIGEHGRRLLEYSGLVFKYWRAYKDGDFSRTTLVDRIRPVRRDFEAALEKAAALEIKGLSGSCLDILHHKKALWTFIDEDGVEPTNNEAEREIRAFVLWRKKCFGAQSQRGHLFAERIMTVAHTSRKQGRPVLSFLTEACRAHVERRPCPSLFAPR
jgi:transposase